MRARVVINDFKLEDGGFRLNVRKKFLAVRVVTGTGYPEL